MTLRVMTFTTKKSPVLDGFKASINGKKTVWNKAHTVFCGRFKTVQDFSSRIQILDGLGKTDQN